MTNKFDDLTKKLAQTVTRRAAFKRFGVGLAGMALASFGLADKASAGVGRQGYCQIQHGLSGPASYTGVCVDPSGCVGASSADCPVGPVGNNVKAYFGCGGLSTPLDLRRKCTFTI